MNENSDQEIPLVNQSFAEECSFATHNNQNSKSSILDSDALWPSIEKSMDSISDFYTEESPNSEESGDKNDFSYSGNEIGLNISKEFSECP